MSKEYVIVPGKSIGPFKLGMTRAEISEQPLRPNSPSTGFPSPGVSVDYDQDGRCNKLHAVFSYRREPPIFTLFGHVVNGMKESRFRALVGGRGTYSGSVAPARGIRAAKWEHSDEHIIEARQLHQSRAGLRDFASYAGLSIILLVWIRVGWQLRRSGPEAAEPQ